MTYIFPFPHPWSTCGNKEICMSFSCLSDVLFRLQLENFWGKEMCVLFSCFFAIFARYFACSSLYLVLSDTYHLLAATICRCVAQVMGALIKIATQHIQMPSVDTLPKVKERFYTITSQIKKLKN